ncbi:MAG: YebC/PmpR family DNA-binding transcriptional regulator [Patescibacteria group bacterium]|nr:YebC/PmpR family DNA-binding transcriptional regulator [Patescibacteria group bacterium]
MSGHSKWSTIKHKKAAADNKRGQIFTKLGRAITIAAKEGGPEIGSNFKLRLAVDKARAVNMPKVNIERAIEKGSGQGEDGSLETVVYEGFGPSQVAVMVEVVTDNKNRTAAEIKKTFEWGGGHLGQPGSASHLFHKKGRLLVEPQADIDSQMLKIIDLGVDEVEIIGEAVEVLVPAAKLAQTRDQLTQAGLVLKSAELIYKPQALVELDSDQETKLTEWLAGLEELDDVQSVFTNW